jgi:hypothetical protein
MPDRGTGAGMSKTEVVRIHCSSCRERIPVGDLLKGKAVSVGKYCFCPKCATDNLLRRIRKSPKLTPCELQREYGQAT